MTDSTKVLLLEDDDFDAAVTIELLKKCRAQEFEVTRCSCLAEAIDELDACAYPVALVDMNLPDSAGLDTVSEVLKVNQSAAIIVLTGTDDIVGEFDVAAMEAGAADYLVKGQMTEALLERSIRLAMTRQKLIRAEIEAKKLLDEKNKKLLEYYQTANSFVDTVSHEFRTPLTVIKEFASVMSDGLLGDINSEQQDYLGTIIHRVNDLSDMVSDLLDISRLEQGSFGICRQAWSIDHIIEKIRTVLTSKAAAHEVTLNFRIGTRIPQVYCDAEKIGRVLINLAVNGFKYSKKGGHVTVWASHDPDAHEVVFGVTDDGPGIPPESLEKIFKRFTRLGGNIRSSTQGFGLGLNIAKELVHLNFGDINVESEVGKGSTFTFTTPTINPIHLLNRYEARVKMMRTQLSHIALIHAETDDRVDPAILNEVFELLHQELRSNDLILCKSRDSWRLIVTTNQPGVESLIERIEETFRRENLNRVEPMLPNVALTPVGQWCLDTEYGSFLRAFRDNFYHSDGDFTEHQIDPTFMIESNVRTVNDVEYRI